ncbi:MAG: DUF87 domain-containing protein [Clostridia bacterium]|nr:DUF87 domain-containing protein [Clostridia bacterium]
MSTTKGKPKKKQTVEYTSTGKNAAVTMTFGIVFLALGICWLLAMFVAAEGNLIPKELARALNGLCGVVCIPFPLLLIWTGIKMLVSTRHQVNMRTNWILLALYVLFLVAFTLITGFSGIGLSYLDYIKLNNAKTDYFTFLNYAYADGATGMTGAKGAGGWIGMLFAYPVWQVMGNILGAIFVICLMIALLFLLIRKNPGELIRAFSEGAEERRARAQQKRAEKEAARLERETQNQHAEGNPVVQQMPMDPHAPVQQVEMQEDEYQYYPDPAPAYPVQTPVPTVKQTVQPVDGFYPVSNELYDEKFPLHTSSAVPVYREPAKTESVNNRYSPAGKVAPIKTSEDTAPVPARSWQNKPVAAEPAREEAPVQPADEPECVVPSKEETARRYAEKKFGWKNEEKKQPVVQPVEDEWTQEEDELPWDETEKPAAEEKKTAVVQKPVEKPVKQEQTLPWPRTEKQISMTNPEAVYQPEPVKKKEEPAVIEEKKPVKPSWSEMVQRRQQEVKSGEMPAHTTTRGEPKPVYTDPVMPISSERIPIKPIPEPKADAKLDGTRAPQMKQTEMTMPIRYQAPPIRLLKDGKTVDSADSAQEDNQRAEVIEGTLGSFGVDAEVKQIMHGPSITRFAIQIAPGVKVSKVTNTADNLALDLKTKHVRVEAPIQGTSYIGIEVPNKLVSTVSLKEVLDSEKMHNATSPLMVALGMDIAGSPVLCDLSKMPHLLIAGATGSGKSVCINSIVCSLLYRSSPEQVRLIMIDPKQVELTVYNSIPHLLVPVISDPRKAAGALAWVVQEMQERYGKFSSEGVRNLAGYNDMYRGTDKELPNIVVIIDEMADLMEVCRKDVEESIRRLAALARAAGIYMVLATQRPSVDVITGVVKNNIPSRIAFAVSSGTDSRTIIDIYGAEKLMGKGDMLYKPAGSSPVRVQGCFVSDDEVNAITDYISRRYQTSYDPNIMEHLENADKETPTADTIGGEDRPHGAGDSNDGTDELLMEAIEMAVEDEQISTSLLQRRFRIGYARAGRLVDEMERRGIVSASEGSKPRKCLITREQYYQMFEDQ